jgi:hypothetical protein
MVSERRNILFFSVTKIVYVQNSASKRSSEIVKLIINKNRAIHMLFYGITMLSLKRLLI